MYGVVALGQKMFPYFETRLNLYKTVWLLWNHVSGRPTQPLTLLEISRGVGSLQST